MAAGVPMYYLTARSRALSTNKGTSDDEGGLRAIFTGISVSTAMVSS